MSTHICRISLSSLINWTSPFPISGVSRVPFRFYFIPNRNSCKQTVKTLIRRRILRRLIWVCTVCLGPKNGTPGLYGLMSLIFTKIKFLTCICIIFAFLSVSFRKLHETKQCNNYAFHWPFVHSRNVQVSIIKVLFCISQQAIGQQQQITMLQNEIDKLRSDNVKLYEKVRYLQSAGYSHKVSTLLVEKIIIGFC